MHLSNLFSLITHFCSFANFVNTFFLKNAHDAIKKGRKMVWLQKRIMKITNESKMNAAEKICFIKENLSNALLATTHWHYGVILTMLCQLVASMELQHLHDCMYKLHFCNLLWMLLYSVVFKIINYILIERIWKDNKNQYKIES